MAAFSMENRPLKKLKLGPPDVYPQDPKQKEDELTPVNVKQGFSHSPSLSQAEEYGSARSHNFSLSKVQSFINGVLAKKQELNTLPDTGRKRQNINPKENFHNVTPKSKAFIESWFRDLAGSKPLLNLGKKVPIFNKKEEIFVMLSEYQVPMVRAVWLVKMTSAYSVAISEAKMKKRQLPDSSQEWTSTLTRFMREQLSKLQEFYQKNNSSSSSSSSTALAAVSASNASSYHNGSPLMSDEQRVALRQFNYCQQLCKVMYEEGLLDCQDFLTWILDMVEKCKTCEDGNLRLVVPLVLQYSDEFVQCEILSRKLAFQVCKRMTPLLQSTMTADNGSGAADPTTSQVALDVSNCSQHRGVLVQMSAIVHSIVLHCPTAVVWNFVGEGKVSSYLIGSPLDQLPVPPSALPMAPRFSNNHVRQLLREAEHRIKIRSKASEKRWSLDRLCESQQLPQPQIQTPQQSPSKPSSQTSHQQQASQTASGVITSRVLQALEALDRHSFDRVDSSNSIDTLYSKIFPPINSSSGSKGSPPSELLTVEQASQIAKDDEPLVKLLCQWAVSEQRYGEHRAIAAALLLEKRQSDLVVSVEGDGATGSDDNDTEESTPSATLSQPIYQGFLMRFLDTEAPTEPGPAHSNRTVFASLVHLFYELIKHDVFSHDIYMCSLISRGDLLSVTSGTSGQTGSSTSSASHPSGPVHSIHSSIGGPQMGQMGAGGSGRGSGIGSSMGFNMGGMGMGGMHDPRSEMDDSKVDDDLEKLLQDIKEDQQIVDMDAPDSPKDEHHGPLDSSSSRGDKEGKRQSRHLLYTTHFPLPQDDSLVHDCNQRHILLYGVGKAREEARHSVKKISKEVCRLFHKKLAIDVQTEGTGSASGGTFGGSSKSRKHSSRIEFNFELTMQRFLRDLSYFDRHAVASQAVSACLEMISGFTSGSGSSSAYLPVLEHLSFLFDLFEVSLSISGLIDLCLQLLKELPEVESLLAQRNSVLSRVYVTNLGLYVVGVLRRFHCCLLLSPELTATAFESLCRIVKHVTNPADCSSAERCILAYLYDLYSCSSFLKIPKHESSSGSSGASGRSGSGGSGSGSGSDRGGEVFAFANAYPKIKSTIFAPVQPSAAVHPLNREFLIDYINNPRRKPEPHVLRQLSDSAQLRYSFVCNVVVVVCNTADNDRLNDIALLCAELTAGCSALSAEWLGVLTALCFSASTYIDVLTQVDVQDISIHNNLAVLFSVLLARHCFGLHDFLLHVGVPSLVKIWNEGKAEADPESEAGARLTCHLVLRFFKTFDAPHPACYTNSSHSVNASPHHTLPPTATTPPSSLAVKLACDRHLLAATHNSISVGPVLAVLKAILVLADRVPADGKSSRSSGSGGGSNSSSNNRMGGEVSISHILGTLSGDLDLEMGSSSFGSGRGSLGAAADQNVSLATYARYVLKQICTQPWVHQRCLQNPEELLKPDGLLDSCLTNRQAQRLLHMISRPETASAAAEDTSTAQQDYRQLVNRVLESLDQWRLRVAWLDLQLLCRQLGSPSGNSASGEMNLFLDAAARAIVDIFELCQPEGSVKEESDSTSVMAATHPGSVGVKGKRNESGPSGSSTSPRKSGGPGPASAAQSITLVAPLVSKLPGSIQGRILKVASQVLEKCNWSPPSANKAKDTKDSKEIGKDRQAPGTSSGRTKSLLSYEPFLALVTTCFKGQDDQREAFLSSLHGQMLNYIFIPKEERLYQGEDNKSRRQMLEALQLRFALVGGLFDAIIRSPQTTVDWAVLFVQLVTAGVIDFSNNTELFATLQDMIATLLHSTQVADAQSERGEDGKKFYQNLIKKIKKEMAERKGSGSIQPLKQLLPLPKTSQEFVTCEAYGTSTDNKGNKIQTDRFDNTEKKQGMRLHEKQRVSPWDIMEGQKTPAPLSWAWFGAVRIERKPLRYQEAHRLLRHHTHIHQKAASYFLEHPILPPEEVEPPPFPEKVHVVPHHPIKEEPVVLNTNPMFKMDMAMPMSEQSPRGASKRGQKTARRPRGRRGAATGPVPIPPQQQSQVGYQNPGGPPGPGMYPPQPPQWSGYGPGGPGPQQQPQQPQPPQQQQPPQMQPQPQQQQQQQQQPGGPTPGFFPQQIGPGVGMTGPRFPPDGRPGTQSRQALTNMLRQKHPGMSGPGQFVPGASGTPPGGPSMPNAPGGVPGVPGNPGVGGGMVGPMGVGVGGPARGVPGQQQAQQPFANMSMAEKQRQQMIRQQQMRQQQPQQQVPIVPGGGGPQGPQGGFPNMHANQNPNFNQGGNFPMQQQQAPQQGNVMGMQQQQQPQQQPNPMMQAQHFNQQQGGGNFQMQQQQVQPGNVMGMQQQNRGMNNPGVRTTFMQQPGGPIQMGQAQFARGAPMPQNPQAQQQVRMQQHQQMMAQQQHGQMQQQQHGHNNYHQQY